MHSVFHVLLIYLLLFLYRNFIGSENALEHVVIFIDPLFVIVIVLILSLQLGCQLYCLLVTFTFFIIFVIIFVWLSYCCRCKSGLRSGAVES
ncbi:hypothetical protein BDB00DRAFT_168862 [Zychaea mexicana]|uniref:uncharacterized protein n=1 Tax=Zychaea mexicana TaxID=64656 RepID=UPI0022FE7172|nr:uncharacterized protein BDB00DRAFT_168862 [Zychaea mexicana]KAI9482569.1 hypothetical protein BDB00DRAFT_168862 [Zychaea mexicana]